MAWERGVVEVLDEEASLEQRNATDIRINRAGLEFTYREEEGMNAVGYSMKVGRKLGGVQFFFHHSSIFFQLIGFCFFCDC